MGRASRYSSIEGESSAKTPAFGKGGTPGRVPSKAGRLLGLHGKLDSASTLGGGIAGKAGRVLGLSTKHSSGESSETKEKGLVGSRASDTVSMASESSASIHDGDLQSRKGFLETPPPSPGRVAPGSSPSRFSPSRSSPSKASTPHRVGGLRRAGSRRASIPLGGSGSTKKAMPRAKVPSAGEGDGTSRRLVEYFVVISSVPRHPLSPPSTDGSFPLSSKNNTEKPPLLPPTPPVDAQSTPETPKGTSAAAPSPYATTRAVNTNQTPRIAQRILDRSVHLTPVSMPEMENETTPPKHHNIPEVVAKKGIGPLRKLTKGLSGLSLRALPGAGGMGSIDSLGKESGRCFSMEKNGEGKHINREGVTSNTSGVSSPSSSDEEDGEWDKNGSTGENSLRRKLTFRTQSHLKAVVQLPFLGDKIETAKASAAESSQSSTAKEIDVKAGNLEDKETPESYRKLDPDSMSTGDLKRELELLGISTKYFLEKGELVSAFREALAGETPDENDAQSCSLPLPPLSSQDETKTPALESLRSRSPPRGAACNIVIPGEGRRDDSAEIYFQPVITARYPATDHKDNPLNPMLPHFCHPHTDLIGLSSEYHMPRIHHFVLTNDRGKKMYGTCLTIYEEYSLSDHEKKVVDALWWQDKGGTVQECASEDEDQGDDDIEVTLQHSPRKRTFYVPRVLCLLSTWPYLTAFREYLTQLYRLATSTNLMSAPIERYVLNLCSEIPAPPPGAFEIRMNILDSTIRFWAPPANQPIPYVSLPFGVLFECLDIDNVLFVWYSLALERKVLLVSSQYSLLTVCSEILCSLLFPMQWSHLYIPILPRFLSPMLDAPMPYLCGLSRDNLPYAVGDIGDETIVVDLDQNVITMGPQTPDLPPIPYKRRVKLEYALEKNAGDVFWSARGLTKEKIEAMQNQNDETEMDLLLGKAEGLWEEKLSMIDEAFNLAFTPDSPNLLNDDTNIGKKGTDGEDKQSQWDAVQEAFLRFFVSSLKGYRKFLSIPEESAASSDLPPRPQTTRWSARRSFQTEEFVASQRSDFHPFLEELCLTQQFDDFITKCLYDPGAPDLIFFNQSIEAKKNRSKLKMKKVDTPFLLSAKAHKVLNKVDAVEPNTDFLPDYDPAETSKTEKRTYLYTSWPETFDPALFGKPRPIPNMITAEFDRQSALVERLRAKHVNEGEGSEFLWDFLGGNCDPSPEVATFTVFFVTYSAVIGRELVAFEQQYTAMQGSLLDTEGDVQEAKGGASGSSPESPWRPKVNPPWMAGGDYFKKLHTSLDPTTKGTEKDDQRVENNIATLADNLDIDACPSCDIDLLEKVETDSDTALMGFIWDYADRASTACDSEILKKEQSTHSHSVTELEEVRAVAKAQLDLAFDMLDLTKLRKLPTDPGAYKCLIEACGRCGDTQRATQLMSMIQEDGLVADSEMYSYFMSAFSVSPEFGVEGALDHPHAENADAPSPSTARAESPSKWSWIQPKKSGTSKSFNISSSKRGTDFVKDIPSNGRNGRLSDLLSDDSAADSGTGLSSISSTAPASDSSGKASDFYSVISSTFSAGGRESAKKARKKSSSSIKSPLLTARKTSSVLTKKEKLVVTDQVMKQVSLGENLLELLYPEIVIDTSSDTCPQCSRVLSEDDIISGWTSCAFEEYSTSCPQCKHRFVSRFSVRCSSPTFEGQQGKGTPLYCEFLSPWVLRKELHSLIDGTEGIDSIIDPKWRCGTDINATLWWNMVVSFMRYRLPITFLLQGSFNNRLIMPTPDAYLADI